MRPYLNIVFSMLVWSTWGPLIRWLAMPPTVVLLYSSLIASVTVPALLRVSRRSFSLKGLGAHKRLLSVLIAASAANNLSYFYALQHTTISNAVFTHYTAPLFVALMAPFLLRERLQGVTRIALPLAVAGMCMIILANGGMELSGKNTPGILAGLFSGIAYAFIILTSRRFGQHGLQYQALVMLLWCTTLVLAPWAWVENYRFNGQTVLLIVIAGLLHSTIAPILYYDAMRSVLAQHAGILGYIEPLAAIPLAWLLFSETPSLVELAGGVTIVISGYLVVRSGLVAVRRVGSLIEPE